MRGARSIRRSRFTRIADGTELLKARTLWAFVDVQTQRPRRIDARMLEAFSARSEGPRSEP